MDKITPSIQETTLTSKAEESISKWFKTEVVVGRYTENQLGWLLAQGWTISSTTSVTETFGSGSITYTQYTLQRRVIDSEAALDDLTSIRVPNLNDTIRNGGKPPPSFREAAAYVVGIVDARRLEE